MECAGIVAFTFAMWQIRLCLLYKLIWPEATIMTLFAILRVSLVRWGKWSEILGCSIAASSEFGKKIKYLQAKQRICQECKDCVIGKETTTVVKITIDNAILELCDSCDFFASPLIKWCGAYSNTRIINDCFGMCTTHVKNPFFATNSSRNICKFIFLRKVNDMIFFRKTHTMQRM